MTESKRILLVEDDPDIQAELVDWLEENGFYVDAVASALAALDHLECKTYDIVLMDGHLPEMKGEELCRTYRESGGKLPVMMLTGRPASEAKEICLAAGANDYLEKPFDLDVLLARIALNLSASKATPAF